MYNAKAEGKDRYVLFEPRMQEVLRERLRLEADIARALVNEEFFLEYQPMADSGTGALLGVQALARWRHPERGVLMPRQFIPLAEESHHIIELGRWVLLRACTDWRQWCDRVAPAAELRLGLNISSRHLQQGDLVRDGRSPSPAPTRVSCDSEGPEHCPPNSGAHGITVNTIAPGRINSAQI